MRVCNHFAYNLRHWSPAVFAEQLAPDLAIVQLDGYGIFNKPYACDIIPIHCWRYRAVVLFLVSKWVGV